MRPVPKIQIIFRERHHRRSARRCRSVLQGTAGNAGLEAKDGPDPARHTGDFRMSEAGTRSLLRCAPDGVELSEEGACHPFDYLGLPCGQIFPPASRLRLAVELALALLFGWDLLPGIFSTERASSASSTGISSSE